MVISTTKWAWLARGCALSFATVLAACSSSDAPDRPGTTAGSSTGAGGNGTGGASSTTGAGGATGGAGTGSASSAASTSSTGGGGSSTTSAGAGGDGGSATTAGAGGTAGSGPGGAGGAGGGAGSGGAGGGHPSAGAGCKPGGSGFDTSVDGVAVDRKTCLVWERNDPQRSSSMCQIPALYPSQLCYEGALSYCQVLRLDGQSDWRLATVAELQSIVVMNGTLPTIDKTVFPQAIPSLYWTSETVGEKVHCVDFNGGPVTNNTGKDGAQGVRCVRSASP